MIINQIKITRATIDDMLDLFELANDPEVRKTGFEFIVNNNLRI